MIALDNRGHGQSTKLYDPADYQTSKMAEDVLALLDHCKIERADIFGYSMGARITAFLAAAHPERVRSAILGGLGYKLVDGVGSAGELSPTALEAPSLAEVTDPMARTFRAFADQTKSDRRALAACIRGSRQVMTGDEVSTDHGAGAGRGRHQRRCGRARRRARRVDAERAARSTSPGRDHMLAVGDKTFKTAVLQFLDERA